MNTCQDCEFYRSTIVMDFCTVDNEAVFPGQFICGFFKPKKESYVIESKVKEGRK